MSTITELLVEQGRAAAAARAASGAAWGNAVSNISQIPGQVLAAQQQRQDRQQQQALAAAARQGGQRDWSRDELLSKGAEVYARICVACHQANGEGIPGVFKPLKGSPIVKGPIADHISRVMNGKPGTAMQAFAAQLSDAEIAAVITHERNSWCNEMGDLVQPAQIKAARK